MDSGSEKPRKPDRSRGYHAEPSRLEQIEDVLHRLSKRLGKLKKEQKEMKADFESEFAVFKETRAAFVDELEQLRKLRVAFEREVEWMRRAVARMTRYDDEPPHEPEPPMSGWDDDESLPEPDPPIWSGDADAPSPEPLIGGGDDDELPAPYSPPSWDDDEDANEASHPGDPGTIPDV